MSHLHKTLGDFRFHRIVSSQPGKPRVQEYHGSNNPERIIWAVWSPTAGNATAKTTLTGVPGKLVSSSRMPIAENSAILGEAEQTAAGTVELEIGASPVYLVFEK